MPNDPYMLLSWVNTKLRDEYASVDELAADLDIDRDMLTDRLRDAGFDYMPEINQFR